MNKTALMLRDAAYIAELFQKKVLAPTEEKQKCERIILRLLHRNNLEMTNTAVMLYNELEDCGVSILDEKAFEIMKSRLFHLIRLSCTSGSEHKQSSKQHETEESNL